MILGLDISTSIVGIALLQTDGSLGSLDYVILKKEKNLFNKALQVYEHLKQYKDLVTDVAIEEPLVMYQPGFSRAQILSKLSMFNGMCSLAAYMAFNKEPTYYNVQHARKLAFPDLKFPKGSDRKAIIWAAVDATYPGIKWPMTPRSNKLAIQCYDMADACVISRSHIASMV